MTSFMQHHYLSMGALRILLRGLSTADSFGRSELESRWSARFPPALTQLLPRRPDLDGLIESVVPGMTWDDASARYRFADAPRTGTNIPPTRTTLTTAHPVPTTARPTSNTYSQQVHASVRSVHLVCHSGIPTWSPKRSSNTSVLRTSMSPSFCSAS